MSRGMCRLPCREGQEDVVQGRPGEADRARLDASGVLSAGLLDQDAVAVLVRDAERAVGDLHVPYGSQVGQGGAGSAGVFVVFFWFVFVWLLLFFVVWGC